MTLSFHLPGQDDLTKYLVAADGLPGWKLHGTPQQAAGDDLFLLIDGGAEIFEEYGFDRALAVEYRGARGGAVNVEIYRMLDPAAAYGVFTFRRGLGGLRVDAGQEAALEEYYLNIWQGRFLVTLTGLDRRPETLAALLPLGRAIAARIGAPAPRPGLADLVASWRTERPALLLFRGRLGLFNHFPLPAGWRPDPGHGLLARWSDCDLVLIRFPDSAAAGAALEELAKAVPPAHRPAELVFWSGPGGRRHSARVWSDWLVIHSHAGGSAPEIDLEGLRRLLAPPAASGETPLPMV